MGFRCIDGDCINAFGNTFHSFEAAKPRETQSAQPLYWHSCHSHCSPSARLYPAKYPSPYHLEPHGKMPCKVRQSAVGFKNGNCTSITSLCPLLQAFFPGQTAKHLIFGHFLSYNYAIAKGRLLRALLLAVSWAVRAVRAQPCTCTKLGSQWPHCDADCRP